MFSHHELGSDPPIGSDRESGRNNNIGLILLGIRDREIRTPKDLNRATLD